MTSRRQTIGPVLFSGDPHGGVRGTFQYLATVALQTQASAVVLLGDIEPDLPLDVALRMLENLPVWWIGGNHDADSDELWRRTWGSGLADRCIHGRVVTLPDGRRVAGLSGVFRDAVWYPSTLAALEGAPTWRTRAEHARYTPTHDRWQGGPHRKHWGTIYPEDVDRLADMETDILVTHEAPGYHPRGFALLDDLARAMGARLAVHGHHHDSPDSSAEWETQGFETHGVGLRGISASWPDGRWELVRPGEIDIERAIRHPSRG